LIIYSIATNIYTYEAERPTPPDATIEEMSEQRAHLPLSQTGESQAGK